MRKSRKINSKFFIFEKEHYPVFTKQRKERMGFFSCIDHPENFYLLTYRQAQQYSSNTCPCLYKDGFFYSGFSVHKTLQDMKDYSYTKDHRAHVRARKDCNPKWFSVSKDVLKVDGDIFYEFEGIKDYRVAKKIEKSIWNRKNNTKKSFYLARFSYELDKMHRDGEIQFNSILWNRGAGVDFFKEYLNET